MHPDITGNNIIPHQLQCGAGEEGQIIACMVQGGILHQHGSRRTFMNSDAIAHINSTVLHTKASAVEVCHGTYLCGAGVENFFRRGRAAQTV